MAKLDEFGRPIYETAEEYNKAHRGGVCPRPYDTSEGSTYKKATAAQRHETVKQSKKLKSAIIGIITTVILGNIGAIFGLMNSFFQEDSYVEYEDEVLYEDGFYDEYLGECEDPLPEGFESFYLNESNCSLPVKFESILAMGYHMDYFYEMDEMFPSGWEEMIDFYDDETESVKFTVRMSNYSGDDLPMRLCTVDYISLENPDAFYDEWGVTPDFVFGDGLTFESTYDELEVYFGIPYYHSEYYSEGYEYDYYEWMYYGDEGVQCVAVTFVDDVMLDVSIEKKPM